MIRRILYILVLAILICLSVSPAAAKAETFNYKFRGLFADAFFSVTDESGCVQTNSYLTPFDGKVRYDKQYQNGPSIYIVVYQYDSCAQEFLLDAWGYTELPRKDFTIKNKLNEAKLDTTVVVDDIITGESFPLDIHLTWTATGEGWESVEHTHRSEPGLRVNYKYTGLVRPAIAIGSITGNSINFAQMPATSAQLSNVKTGFVEITMNP